MKVLLVCTVPTEKSGIPNVIMNHLESMKHSGIEFGYVSINDPSQTYKDILDRNDVELYIVLRQIKSAVSYVRQLVKIAKGYDVMHVHGNSATMVLEMIAAKLAGIKVRISHSHNTSCSAKIIDKLARPMFYTLCNARMACGIEAGKWLFRNRDFKVINNGIDTGKFRFKSEIRDSLRRKLGIKDEVVVGHIGNFNYQKNHEFLIKIFAEFHEMLPNSRLLLLGDGPLIGEMRQEVKNLGLGEAVMFAGSVENPQDYMNVMDLVIMPSRFEGLPLTMIEEQANGLPILASDCITKDANLTRKVFYQSLDAPVKEWAENAIEILYQEKRGIESSNSSIVQIKSSGFDINEIAQELITYYRVNLEKTGIC